ncbi:MAG: TatD family hydrolase [Opitutales bacterium]
MPGAVLMPHPSYYDAHVHLAHPAIAESLDDILEGYQSIALKKAVVVGTSPADWSAVAEIADRDHRFIPAVGLHPWQVNARPDPDWKRKMLAHLEQGVTIIGEIGLDQWIKDHDIESQLAAFRWQFALATERNLPTSIHCLKAHEPLLQTLRQVRLPERGFALHAYNGPPETIWELLDLGAFFSVNGGQLKPNAKRIHELLHRIPEDRLLIETDAPDFLPPKTQQAFHLRAVHDERQPPLNHPANLKTGYQAIAEARGCSVEELAEIVEANFTRYFL